jgi:CBS domain-containing protein
MVMQTRDVMQTNIHTIRSSTSLAELEQLLLEHRVSGFPVVDAGALQGVVSRSDVVRALGVEHTYEEQLSDYYGTGGGAESIAQMGARIGARFEQMTVGDVMMKNIVSVSPDLPLSDVAALLVERGIHRVPVCEDGQLVGLLTSTDLVRAIAAGQLVAADTQ